MGYLEEMNLRLENQNFPAFLQLWEEYKTNQEFSGEELAAVLRSVRESEFHSLFGPYAEDVLSFLEKCEPESMRGEILKSVLDLQTTNTEGLANAALEYLESHYAKDPLFKEKIRLVGLRNREHFEGAIRNFELLTHMVKGNFVYHFGGWGAGEVMDVSLIREQVSVEFENVLEVREVSFANAFHTLAALEKDHFLARRFGDPDALEREAKSDPVKIVKLLLKDLGPKTAGEIRDELYELVIPEGDWTKWWQLARAKCKRDPKIKSPKTLREPFILLEREVSREKVFASFLESHREDDDFPEKGYRHVKQYPEVLKDQELKDLFRELLLKRLQELSEDESVKRLEIFLILEDLFHDRPDQASTNIIVQAENLPFLVEEMRVTAMRKRLLTLIREHREDWGELFAELFLSVSHHFLRDYLLKELMKSKSESEVRAVLRKLLDHPFMYPECFVWYFQKIQTDEDLYFSDPDGKRLFFEALFILLYHLEGQPKGSDLCKKIHSMIVTKNFELFRKNIAGSDIDYIREVLLLITKCRLFNGHDYKLFLSLAKVVHPSLKDQAEEGEPEDLVIWTSQEGYQKLQERIRHIATVETVENAKEIETARAYGDLRENSEYKFAQEKRARLQAEMKLLSSQLGKSRIISPDDIDIEKVGIGTVVTLRNEAGRISRYTVLGPWDADPDKNILSFQSLFAKAMNGLKKGETFSFRDEVYTIEEIGSFTARV